MRDNPWGEIQIEVEEVVDENPNLYLQRAEEALREKRYSDALKECDEAIRYSNNGIEFLCQKIRILFALGNYSECVRTVLTTNLWNHRDELNASSKEEMFKAFAKSYKKCNLPLEKMPIIILTDDGAGMCDTIQEAVKRCNKNQMIYLTTGTYRETIEIDSGVIITASKEKEIRPTLVNYEEECIFAGENKEIFISNLNLIHRCNNNDQDYNGALLFKNVTLKLDHCSIEGDAHGLLTDHCIIDINECCFNAKDAFLMCITGTSGKIQNSKFNSKSDHSNALIDSGKIAFENCIFDNTKQGLNLIDSNVTMSKCQFEGRDSSSLGFSISSDKLKYCTIETLDSDFVNCGVLIQTNAKLEKCKFYGGEYGILSDAGGNVEVIDCKVKNIQGRGISNSGQASIVNSIFEDNEIGIYSYGRSIHMKDSRIKSNKGTGIAIESDGTVENCIVQQNKENGLLLGGKINIRECLVQGNVTCGIAVCDGITSIYNTKIYDNGDAGVYCYENSEAYISDCMIYCNKCANAAVDDHAYMEVTNSSISSSSSYGVWARNQGRCDLKNCEVFNNAKSGTAKSENGLIYPLNCNIHDNESIVGSLSGIRRFFTS
jgi:tetratricopeptide (TPR) repeat protein